MTTETSRRTVLSLVAAAPAAAMPAVAVAAITNLAPDPVLEAIHVYRWALHHIEVTGRSLTEAEERLQAMGEFGLPPSVPIIVDIDEWRLICAAANDTELREVLKPFRVRHCYNVDQIDDALATVEAIDEGRANAREGAIKDLRAKQAKRLRAKRSCGHFKAEAAWDAACDAGRDALRILVHTAPTTTAGARALLDHVLSLRDSEVIGDEELVEALLKSLLAFIDALPTRAA